jgi:hypothetical protein
MKVKTLIIALGTILFMACASPEQRSEDQMDTTTITGSDTVGTDTTTNVNGRSGDNSTGTDTTNTAEQKALRESGK